MTPVVSATAARTLSLATEEGEKENGSLVEGSEGGRGGASPRACRPARPRPNPAPHAFGRRQPRVPLPLVLIFVLHIVAIRVKVAGVALGVQVKRLERYVAVPRAGPVAPGGGSGGLLGRLHGHQVGIV